MTGEQPTSTNTVEHSRRDRLSVEITADATTGYAAIQNNVPVIRALAITNNTDVTVSDLEVQVRCSPAFAAGTRFHFDSLAPGETRKISPIDLKPDHDFLRALDETERSSIAAVALSGGEVLGECANLIDVLAYDQWAGVRALPELLAAFCMPNSRLIDQLLGKAATLLSNSSRGDSMDGYQSKNRERVWKQISAIYSTLLAEDLHYSNPPASFGTNGQKIRTPERIFDGRVATCLDLAMLFASCIEQTGLRPIVLFKEGHAWAGAWLIDSSFPTAVVDDVQAVRKRVKSGELLTFECTGVAGAQKPSLRWAMDTGAKYLDEEEDSFRYVVDIHRARQLQIRALPSRSATPEESAATNRTSEATIEVAPPLPPLDPALLPIVEGSTEETPEGRLAKWKSKLLDLTLRNRLLNFKPTKTNLHIVCPDAGALEDSLSEGHEFRLRPAPKIMAGEDPRAAAVFSDRTGKSPLDALAEDALARREMIVDLPEEQLDGRLTEIFRAAETGKEEGGVNTLFLSFGLLQWLEDKNAETAHLAPILLIPVSLSRQSVRSGFRLTRHDDDALVNPTLVQKLWQDFNLRLPSFETLPTDDKGLDVDKILQTFRVAVGEIAGWEVKDQVHLGIFSFTKYLMWKDLQDRQERLKENAVVAHLIDNPGKAFAATDLGFAPEDLDDTHKPEDLFAPLLADSSQLRAICVASDGKNLVVEGPPGTGKSQTITNLISHLLAEGKTVLFVSEKMAALEVVHRRLTSIGLGPFCLELHSAKAKKSDVLKQLGFALEAAGARTVRDWDMEAERLAVLRQELNSVVRALHREHSNGLTIYEALGTCVKYADRQPASMEWTDPSVHSHSDLEGLRDVSRQIAALASQLPDIARHPLSTLEKSDWSPTWQEQLLSAASSLNQAAANLHDAAAPMLRLFGLPDAGLSLNDFSHFDSLADTLIRAPDVPAGVARTAHDEGARGLLRKLRDHGLRRQQAWDSLNGSYAETVTELNAADVGAHWQGAQATWWPRRWFAKRTVTKTLGAYRTDGQRPDDADVETLAASLAKINAEDEAIAGMAVEVEKLLHDKFDRHRTNWDSIREFEAWAEAFSEAVIHMAGSDLDRLGALRSKLQPYTSENRALLKPTGAIGAGLVRFRDAHREFEASLHRASELACCSKDWLQGQSAAGALQRVQGIVQGWQIAARQIQPWCGWQRVKAKAFASGLAGLVRALEAGEVALPEIAEHFEFSYRSWWSKKAVDREPVLCAFSSADHERKIGEFRRADERFQKLTEQYVAARLAGQVPSSSALVPEAESEMGKLRRELQKQRRHMPIRQLVQSLPSLLSRLKPCLLMSPLSVAQYLDAGHAPFDVVIFDEASQIPVWDAVGAIARGKQLVCVGDPKQLPPTNFFNRVDVEDDSCSEDDVQDLESILDECLSIGLPKLGLNWHYRSRHESLITFSNVTYYENRLVTFPSPVTDDRAVRFERVQGVYDRGGSRTNRAEAEAIVRAIEHHFLNAATRGRSLGVVTFNQAQQNLIENLLDARRRASQALDNAIAQAAVDPLFIKNLENVQGDERDVIYFSVTYGPDAAGKVSLNFGPLNTEGGHRRLNVAVSRARHSIVVFSTLMPEQIDLARVRAAGVRDLKSYLEFAIRGPRAIVEQAFPTGREPDSPFEVQVISALRNKGWSVHPQVGVSGYRIDIGIVDPRASGSYLLGVECDGRTYHSGATARDRDRLRHLILEGLGWNLHRVWSTDWWLDPQNALGRLLTRLENLANAEPPAITEGADAGSEDTDEAAGTEQKSEEAVYARLVEPAPTELPKAFTEYHPADVTGGSPDAFYQDAARRQLRQQLLDVVNAEGPVADSILFMRVARAWGLRRTGRQIRETLGRLVPGQLRSTRDGDVLFYWPEGANPAVWDSFRVAGNSADSKRALEDISVEEIGNLALLILAEHGTTSFEALARSVCRLFGIGRTSVEAENRVRQAVSTGRVSALVNVNGDTVRSSTG